MSIQMNRYEMSDEHKAQLAMGREQSRVVRRYLDALRQNAPKRGRKRSVETVEEQLERVKARLQAESEPLRKLHLMAERERLERDISKLGEKISLTVLEQEFVKVAASYSQRKGISYQAWRALGVSAPVLREAGVSRAA